MSDWRSEPASDAMVEWMVGDVARVLQELVAKLPLPSSIHAVIVVGAQKADGGVTVALSRTEHTAKDRAGALLIIAANQVMTEVRAEDQEKVS